MSGMNEFLAQYYGTNGAEVEKTASDNESGEQEKIAMFAKLAKDNGIDLASMSDEKLDQLFRATFEEKTAGELPPQFQKKDDGEKKDDKKDEKDEEKKAADAAAAEEQEKKAEEDRLEKQAQEADFMGRIMAHAYVNEMRKIAAAAEAKPAETPAAEPEKTASIREKLLKLAGKDEKAEEKKEEKSEKKDGDDKGKSLPPWLKDKEASASLEDAAAQHALAIVQEFNKTAGENAYDVKVAAERISAVHTLGLRESEKVASAESAEMAVGLRALEYLEAAGYPVTWPAS